ncbi:MAG: GGDEF domain-containing protein [Actinomycetota bacterium]
MEQQDAPVRTRSQLPSFIYLGIGVALAAVYVFLPQTGQNFAQNAAGASAVIAVLVGTRWNRPHRPVAWVFMALGLLLLFVGDSIWTYYEEFLHIEAPFPSLADAAYLIGYVPLAVGLMLVVRARRPGHDTGSLIDAAIVTAAFGVGSWIFLIEPAIEPGGSALEIIVSIAYPMVDVLLIAVVAALAFGTVMRAFSYRLITASLLSLIIADILYSVGTIGDWYNTGNPLDIGWIMSNVLWGAAALHPSMRKLTEEGRSEPARFTRRRLTVYILAVLAVPAMRIVLTFGGGTKQGTLIAAGAAVMSLLVLARMAGLLTALESAALQDPLTGLPNRRLLLDRISQAFRRAERSQGPVAVLFLDLGGFKHVNDRFGHEAGDEALVEIARRIKSAVRASDTVARLGGDEFVIVCEGLSKKQAESLARRIRAGVASPLSVRGSLVELTVDLGIAVEHANQQNDVSHLLSAADRAMYDAKHAAKARVEASPKEDASR